LSIEIGGSRRRSLDEISHDPAASISHLAVGLAILDISCIYLLSLDIARFRRTKSIHCLDYHCRIVVNHGGTEDTEIGRKRACVRVAVQAWFEAWNDFGGKDEYLSVGRQRWAAGYRIWWQTKPVAGLQPQNETPQAANRMAPPD
jgi:hypothetical protein